MKRFIIAFIVFHFCVNAFALQRRKPLRNPHGKIKFECQACHSTNSWKIDVAKMRFHHERTGFPLIGAHAQVDCRNCHEHNKTKMDDEHREVRNYQYLSSACYNCHPRGSE
ncbi:MAG: hypothetical protein GXO75_02735 [Calditrichaeota bacterium]|nr:hypothetical protein [Calditrichota bacterium]